MNLFMSAIMEQFTSKLLLLIAKYGDEAKVIDVIAKEREEMKAYDALYHIRKVIGLNKEVQKHIDSLHSMGIDLYDTEEEVVVKSGIEKFGVSLSKEGIIAEFDICGTTVFEVSK